MIRVGRALLITSVLTSAAAALAAEPLVPPPEGAPMVLEAYAEGVQIYNCEPEHGALAWVFKSPEASLYDKEGRQIGRHYGGPTWRLEDGSAVVGDVVAKADSPAPKAIPWLLLRAKSHDGAGKLNEVAFVRRIDTKDGLAPPSGCDEAHAGHQARMRYSATYQFYGAAKQ